MKEVPSPMNQDGINTRKQRGPAEVLYSLGKLIHLEIAQRNRLVCEQ